MPAEPPASRDLSGLYRATVQPLRRYLARLLGNAADAEEVAHDAYLRIQPSVDRKEAQNPEALLYTTARRLAFNQLKRRRIAPFASDGTPVEHTASTQPDVVHQVMARQEWQHMEHAIASLPEGCRTVLVLRKVEFLSHKEIAQRLGITVSTVEKQHARALRLLRASLEAPAALPDQPTAARATPARP